jgi:toxin ParE1/3/4
VKVRFTRTAAAELDRALSHVHAHDPMAAARIAGAIEQSVAWIARWPLASPEVPGRGVRSKLVPKYQYRVFYVVVDDAVVVRNIRSTRELRPWERP